VTDAHEHLSWEEFGAAARELASLIVADLRTAVLYEKPRFVVRCDYVWRRTDRWIDFPWSTLPPLED
jgi:uncharacterized protein